VTYSKTRTVDDPPLARARDIPMRVIPVLDVRRGRAVRAVAGDRDHYGPLRSVVHPGSDPIALAGAGQDAWELPDLYLADLDAILGQSAPNRALFRAIRELGLTIWVDAGVRDAGDLAPLLDVGVDRIVVGLETVRGPEALGEIVTEAGRERVVFSLDLHQGRPMVDTRAAWGTDRAERIASMALEAGVVRLIHLDLARVGTGLGVAPFDRPAGSGQAPAEWIVGGGISGLEEIRALDRQGVGAVLVGSALHEGRLTAQDLRSP
jgi:phosphoribosylformimino-5-aminoimidazole carboxamide ribotide isomerase